MIPEYVKKANEFVALAASTLELPDLQDLVRGSAQALGLHDLLRSCLSGLRALFLELAEGLRWLAHRVEELAGAVALGEIAAPILGGVGEVLASLAQFLSDFGAPYPPDADAVAGLRLARSYVDLGVDAVGAELPDPNHLEQMAGTLSVRMVEALALFDPDHPTNRTFIP